MTETKTMKLAQHQYQVLMNMKNTPIVVTGSGKAMVNVTLLKPSTESTTGI
jgi:hypothetical protein